MPCRRVIPVACAVIEDGSGRVFVAQRPAHKHLGLKWEFPGGKIEPGESPATALQREIDEELACAIEIRAPLPAFEHDYGDLTIAMHPFVCRLAPGAVPAAREHVNSAWLAEDRLRTMDLAPADWPVVNSYFG